MMQEILHYFTAQYQSYTTFQIWVETIAAALGVLSTWFASKNSIWVFPTGIINTILYVYLLFVFNLFGDMIVNFYYFVMSIYGWIHWSGKDNHNIILPITTTTFKEKKVTLFIFLLSVIFVFAVYFFYYYQNNQFKISETIQNFTWVNYIDAFTTSLFFAGMWLMAKRKIENWVLWIIGDIMVIPMFFHKNLAITALQYMIFLILAIKGYQSWQKEYNSTHNAVH